MNKKSKSLSITNDSKSLLQLLNRFEEEVKVKSIIHFETYKYYQKIFFILNYPALFISFIINSALFTRLVEDNANMNLFLVGNVITLLCNIVIGGVSYYRLDDKMNNHLHYSKEYTRIYRIICNFYYENLVCKEKLHKEILFHFIQNIQSHIFLLFDDEPKCPSNIVHNVKINNVDICFYVYASKKYKNQYTYENVFKLYQLPTSVLYSIMNEIETNPLIHMKYPGFYRYNITKEIPKKDILNYILLEKNISYNDIFFIYNNLNNKDNLKVIHTIESEYDNIYIQEHPIIIIDELKNNESPSSSSKASTPNSQSNVKILRSTSEPIFNIYQQIENSNINDFISKDDITDWEYKSKLKSQSDSKNIYIEMDELKYTNKKLDLN